MKADCADCDGLRHERAAQIRTGKGDLGDLLTRTALHEAIEHREKMPASRRLAEGAQENA
ncbi:hypothetical protein [Streptomyces sp. NPDC058145]|uniref:hypothetical protein n=1 Tax=Streptomyces sp. NPDC058145 TaxID=3346356 RepID=UPI0036F0752D